MAQAEVFGGGKKVVVAIYAWKLPFLNFLVNLVVQNSADEINCVQSMKRAMHCKIQTGEKAKLAWDG